MAIRQPPLRGTILACDFNTGFSAPEMVKLRPVIVVSNPIRARPNLCTVVCCSTREPRPILPYHCVLDLDPPMPIRWQSNQVWVKADMIYAVSFNRLNLISMGKDQQGKRQYRYDVLSDAQMRDVDACILNGIGLGRLTKHLE